MEHKLFGNLIFNIGWKTKKTIRIFEKEYQVTLKLKAYFEEDGITKEQERGYTDFIKMEEETLGKVTKMLREYDPFAEKRFIPKTLLLNRDGSLALLCYDNEEPDEGIAVCIIPKMQIMSQDDYL